MHARIATTDRVYVLMEERPRGNLLAGNHARKLAEAEGELRNYLSRLSKGDLLGAINLAAAIPAV